MTAQGLPGSSSDLHEPRVTGRTNGVRPIVLGKRQSTRAGMGTRTPAYFFRCFLRKSMARCHAVLALASWKLPRSSQWKPCCASG
jgi:hypothetical protein